MSEKKIELSIKEEIHIPVEADCLSPDVLVDMNTDEIKKLPLYQGNRKISTGELFDIRGEKSNNLIFKGDLTRIKKIGLGMSSGTIEIYGNVGMHLGSGMKGGEITVHGNASDWAGAQMEGGRIRIEGSASHFIGGAYPGETKGMMGGSILVEGNGGDEIGNRMRRGCIAIKGNAGSFLGAHMIAGTIAGCGTAGCSAGAGMKRGTILLLNRVSEEVIMPTFRYAWKGRPLFLNFFLSFLESIGFVDNDRLKSREFEMFVGDFATLGKGELFALGG